MAACGARVRRPGAVFVAPALYRADFSYVARNNRRRMRYKFVSAHATNSRLAFLSSRPKRPPEPGQILSRAWA